MPNIRTGISIREDLAEEADILARELRVSRSQLYAMALGEFIRRHENRTILERLNAAHGDPLDDEEERLLRGIKEHSRRLLEEER